MYWIENKQNSVASTVAITTINIVHIVDFALKDKI